MRRFTSFARACGLARHVLLRRLGEERGIALAMALGVMSVLLISGTTIVYFSSTNARTASRSSSDQKAYALAEAGMNDALSILENALDPRTSTLLPQTTVNLDGGTATYSGTIDANDLWTLTSIGSVRSPSGALSNVTRTLKRTVQILGLNQSATGIAWSRFYQDSTATCLTIDGVNWPAPVSTRGDLCLVDGATITGSTTTVDVGGNVSIVGPDVTSSPRAPSAASGWTNSTNVFTSNSVYATNAISSYGTGATLQATGFGFSIPSTAIIKGITVSVVRKASTSFTLQDSSVYLLKSGSQTGTNHAVSGTWSTSNTTKDYGSTSDLWGTTWTAANINASNFGVKFVARAGSSSATASVDYITVTVTYSDDTNGVGTAGTPIAEANVTGTCTYNANAPHSPCSSADKVYASNITTAGKNLTMPQIDFAYWWAHAKPGPKYPCTTSTGTPPSFDNDAASTTGPNDSIPINGEMTPLYSDYTCKVIENGIRVGELSWNHTTHDLTIYGTVFVDGNFRFDDDGQVVHYHGRGDIFAGGAAEIDELVCAGGSGTDLASSCYADMSNWDPSQNMLVLLSMYTGQAEYDQGGSHCSPTGTTSCPNGYYASGFQGVLYSKGDCLIHQMFRDSGPVICNSITLPNESNGNPTYYPYPQLSNLTGGQKYTNPNSSSSFELQINPMTG
jgi:hypothetical protein